MGTETTQAVLIPFDPEDDTEQQLLTLQRVICGWKQSEVPKMCAQMREGRRLLFWIGLPSPEGVFMSMDGKEALPHSQAKAMTEHFVKMPLLPRRKLSDVKTAMVGSSASKVDAAEHSTQGGYIPAGHISIDAADFDYWSSDVLGPDDGKTLCLTTLFVLTAYKKKGLGTWAMKESERLMCEGAIIPPPPASSKETSSEPRKCTNITLSCLHGRHLYEDGPEGRGMWERSGQQIPESSKQKYLGEWYKGMGYVRYHEQKKWALQVYEGDPSAKPEWWAEFWKKAL